MAKLDLRVQRVSFAKINGNIEISQAISYIKEPKQKTDRCRTLIDIELVIAKGNEFLKTLNIENSRFLSWEHCYSAFADCKETANDKVDFLCLHLAFYLASWGMYRGSSFLLWKDYLVHREAVVELLKPKYKKLRGANCKILIKDNNIDLIIELSDKLKKIYIEKRKNVSD
jgi:hypothetical protein